MSAVIRTARVIVLAAALSTLAAHGWAQSEMKPLNEAELRQLGIYEAKELTRRATELWEAGKVAEAVPLAEQALQRREKYLAVGHPELSASIVMLGRLYQRAGRLDEAEPLFKRGLAMRQNANPQNLHSVANTYRVLGDYYDFLSRFSDAEGMYRRVLEIREKLLKPDDPLLVDSLNTLAAINEKQGRYGEAEKLYKRGLDLRESLTSIPLGKGPDGKSGQLTIARGYTEHADTISALARIYALQGRFSESERLFRQVVQMYEKAARPGDHRIATSLDNLAGLYHAFGRFTEAEELYLRSLRLREQAAPPVEMALAASKYNLGMVHYAQGRYVEAELLLKQALATRLHRLPPDNLMIADSMLGLAQLKLSQDRAVDAAPLLEKAHQILERLLPAGHPRIAYAVGESGFLQLARRDWKAAYKLFQRATDEIVREATRTRQEGLATLDPAGRVTTRDVRYFGGFVAAAYQLAQSDPGQRDTLVDAGFAMLQWAQRSAAAASLAQMAARNARQDARLAALARQRQDLVTDWEAVDKELVAVSSLPAERRSQFKEQTLRRHLLDAEASIAAVDQSLAEGFPDYAALVSPKPLRIAEVQALLGEDEVLVAPFHVDAVQSSAGGTFVWAVSKTESRLVRSSLDARELRGHVRALRCGLDREAWETASCARHFKGASTPGSDEPLPFDISRAHQIYTALFGQIEPLIRGKHLLFVPSDAMTTLPLQTLVTELPQQPASYRETRWLIRKHAITILPTVTSLQSLRRLVSQSKASKSFVGFGNPLLLGPNEDDRSAYRHADCASTPVASNYAIRAVRVSRVSFFSDGLADVNKVRTQYPLPETADELCTVGRASGASEDAIYLGARATEGKVKELSENGALSNARVVHFATHGLLAGETRWMAPTRAEPALILTPPERATIRDDGLLTASEIAQLRLDADWVVLSACNTAAAAEDGDDAEALSGLARAFFYAGARALLVSHWAVNSEATVKLISGTFTELATNPQRGRAEALRRSMLGLIADGEGYAHPSIWAPFVVVGEGGAR